MSKKKGKHGEEPQSENGDKTDDVKYVNSHLKTLLFLSFL